MMKVMHSGIQVNARTWFHFRKQLAGYTFLVTNHSHWFNLGVIQFQVLRYAIGGGGYTDQSDQCYEGVQWSNVAMRGVCWGCPISRIKHHTTLE